MPGISQRINNTSDDTLLSGNGTQAFHSCNGSSVSGKGFWSEHRNDVSYNQMHKFWCELTLQARQELLRIDKQTLFEHARKNMYCSRCNGLLLEGFLQIVMYGKSLQQDVSDGNYSVRAISTQKRGNLCMENGCQDDAQDPSVHPWGGLTTTRDGTLTVLDCYLCSKSLKGLQNVFDSARARERERELLYPDACGGGSRGWTSQGMGGYGRGHVTRETCALHTARLSVATLADFWSALGEETRRSLLKMKEEDFIEMLMYRFDSKRFCRDCRRNVIREFKELKELKRMRKDPRCTSWFCVADTAFQYEVSLDTVQADWHQTFFDTFGKYHHFEWAIGTGEGKSDILEFENVGLSVRVQVNGLDLSGLNACYITLRAWKMDGRCSELCVKAHALRGQKCVHCRLVVGDGFITISRGENIRRFFEHAEEAEEEEDDDSMDKDENGLDSECARPQKHAKSPELAREFLLDAATVIFKEQVEKAFREGTARQNAHSMFVSLALNLLEERLHIACKEIITLEKQTKLLEEEEKEKREEEERKERRRTKEREKKLRRKDRLREKENKEKKCVELNENPVVPDVSVKDSMSCMNERANTLSSRDPINETGEASPASPLPSYIQDDQLLTEYIHSDMENHFEDGPEKEFLRLRDWNTSFPSDHYKYSSRRLMFHNDNRHDWKLKWSDRRNDASYSDNGVISNKYEARYHGDGFEFRRGRHGFNKQVRTNAAKLGEDFQCSNNIPDDRYDSHCCNCNHHTEHKSRPELHFTRVVREPKCINKLESQLDIGKPNYRGNKYTQVEDAREIKGRPKSKIIANNSLYSKKVWEPLDSRKKYIRSNSDSDVTLRSKPNVESSESDQIQSSNAANGEFTGISVPINHEDHNHSSKGNCKDSENGFHGLEKSGKYSNAKINLDSSISSTSNSDNCSSCLSEGSNTQNLESTSTSDSEESTQNSEERGTSQCFENQFNACDKVVEDQSTGGQDCKIQQHITISSSPLPTKAAPCSDNGGRNASIVARTQNVLPHMHNQSVHYPMFHAPPTMGYYHQTPVSWPVGPANGLLSFPHSSHYLYPNGYGTNGNAQFVQYGVLQHLAPPLLNPGHVPVFQPAAQVYNGYSTKEQSKVSNDGLKLVVRCKSENVVSTGQNVKPDTMDKGNGFSLFHFGGPIALSTGLGDDHVSLKEGITGDDDDDDDATPNFLADCNGGYHHCGKKDSVEEYNLFATSNGIKFSFF